MEFLPSAEVTAIRSRLDHPIIDADGHAIEYLPLVRDILREQAGDDAVAVMDLVTGGAAATRGLTPGADARRGPHPHVVVGAPGAQHARPWYRAPARSARGAAARARHRPRGAVPHLRAGAGGARRRRRSGCRWRARSTRSTPRRSATTARRSRRSASSRCTHPRRRSPSSTTQPESSASRRSCSAGRSAVPPRASIRRRARRAGSTRSGSTRCTTTTRCGSAASTSGCRRRSTPRRWDGRSARRSSNYVFNHIGMFAIAGEMLALSLFMGGVPQRFPQLRFAFQEGGVAWAAALLRQPHRSLGEAQPRRGRALQPRAPRPLAGGVAVRGVRLGARTASGSTSSTTACACSASPTRIRRRSTSSRAAASPTPTTSATCSPGRTTSGARPTIP